MTQNLALGTSSRMRWRSGASSLAKGSSSISASGRAKSERASATRARCPPESVAGVAAAEARLGYPVGEQHYLAGFVLHRESAAQWAGIDAAAERAIGGLLNDYEREVAPVLGEPGAARG